jgi:hypothetical protein
MRRFIVKKEQLNEYVEKKKTDKVYYDIMLDLYNNMNNLSENVSLKKANQSVIDGYNIKGLITPRVSEMLIKHNIINQKHEII